MFGLTHSEATLELLSVAGRLLDLTGDAGHTCAAITADDQPAPPGDLDVQLKELSEAERHKGSCPRRSAAGTETRAG
jgi:hypothetical protein